MAESDWTAMIRSSKPEHCINMVSAPHKKNPIRRMGLFLWIMGFERPLRKQSSGLFLGRGRIHGTQAAAPKSRRQVPFLVSHILRFEVPQNALDPDLTQTGNFTEKYRMDCCPPGFLLLWC